MSIDDFSGDSYWVVCESIFVDLINFFSYIRIETRKHFSLNSECDFYEKKKGKLDVEINENVDSIRNFWSINFQEGFQCVSNVITYLLLSMHKRVILCKHALLFL